MTIDRISADDPDFDVDPPSSEEIEVDRQVAVICGLLEQAGRGQHTAWALSEALASLAKRRLPLISPAQAIELKQAALRAELAARRLLPAIYSRDGIRTGMWAAGLQIARWAGDNAALKRLPPGVDRDIDLYARIFRNDLHNMSIAEELHERLAKRQAKAEERSARQTAEIIRKALDQVLQPRGWRTATRDEADG